jgi:DNA primase
VSLSTQFLDELRARTCLSALIGKSVRLKKAGNEWKACCPFHQENTPSFWVNDDKAFAHCFGCAWHGDAIKWLQEARGLEFLDAVRELAAAAGMEMPARDPGQQERLERASGMHEVLHRAAGWFADQLQGVEGGAARAYLDRRGITEESVRRFGLGFAPDSRSRLRTALTDWGDQALVESGLLADPGDGREPYDRFRGRLIFPIHDGRGRVIAFGGRIIGQGEPKYLNSPETAVFDKGRTLFNLHRATPAARRTGRVIAVEGPLDVIALDQVGIAEAVASQGTALTEAQIGLLWRAAANPLLCFDGDTAGKRAGAKAAGRALPGIAGDRSLSFVAMPPGKDPDDVAREGGALGFEALVAKAMPLVDMLWMIEKEAAPLATPEAKAALRQRLLEHAGQISDPDVRREYEREFKQRVDALFAPPPRPPRGKRGKPPPRQRTTPPPDPTGLRRKQVTAVLRGLARHETVLADRTEQVAQLPVETDAQRHALDLLLDSALAGGWLDPAAVDDLFPDDRGWRGLVLSFLRPDTLPARAEADLAIHIDLLTAEAGGADQQKLVQMARDYSPPEPPAEGKLL